MTEIVGRETDVVEKSLVDALFSRADAYINDLLGMGGSRDPSVYTRAAPRGIGLPDTALTALYVEDPDAARSVDLVVDHALRAGWDLQTNAKPEDAADQRVAYALYEARVGVPLAMAMGARWGRLRGGAVTWFIFDEGGGEGDFIERQKRPLDLAKIDRVIVARTYDRRRVTHEKVYQDPRSPKFGQTATFKISLPKFGIAFEEGDFPSVDGGIEVHESRLVLWPGAVTDDERKIERGGWDDSVLERLWEALRSSAEDYGSKSMVLNRISMFVFKMKNLGALIASSEPKVRKRLDLLTGQWTRGKAATIDTEEAVEQFTQPVAGIDTVLDKNLERTARASGTAPSIFAGKGVTPADQDGHDEDVIAWRDRVIAPRHRQIATYLLSAKDGPTGGKLPAHWKLVHRPLHTPRPEVRAAIRKLQAETDAAEVDKGILPPEAVALQRHTALGAGDGEVMLDELEVRAALERRRELAKRPPKDNAELGTVGARDAALGDLQNAFFNGEIPEDAALARLELVFQFSPEDARRLLRKPDGWEPTPPAPKPGPAPAPAKGTGAGAPQGLPGFDDGGDPNDKKLPPKASGANE